MNFYGVSPKNDEQKELFKLLSSDKKVIAVTGRAGSGKSLILGAYCAEMITSGEYTNIVFSKPMEVVGSGKFLGAMPGDENEKFDPFLMSFRYLFQKLSGEKGAGLFDFYVKKELIKFIPIEFMRGISFPEGTLVYVDEAQNLDSHSIHTLGTRLEDGCRLLLSGDLNQVDVKTKNFTSGLEKVISSEAFDRSRITGHVHLTKIERGAIASLFADIFESK